MAGTVSTKLIQDKDSWYFIMDRKGFIKFHLSLRNCWQRVASGRMSFPFFQRYTPWKATRAPVYDPTPVHIKAAHNGLHGVKLRESQHMKLRCKQWWRWERIWVKNGEVVSNHMYMLIWKHFLKIKNVFITKLNFLKDCNHFPSSLTNNTPGMPGISVVSAPGRHWRRKES